MCDVPLVAAVFAKLFLWLLADRLPARLPRLDGEPTNESRPRPEPRGEALGLPEKLVWHDSSADADRNVIPSPMMADWPRVIQTTVTFEDAGDRTNVRLHWVPFEATDVEIACFAGSVANMGSGWGSGFALMDELLAELRS